MNDGERLFLAREQTKNNHPPIEVGDYWSAKNGFGKSLRRFRIVGRWPFENKESLIIVEEQPSKMARRATWQILRVPELNLRYVYERETHD